MVRSLSAPTSFFGRFKGRLRKLDDRDPGGRYFAVLLEQAFLEAPELLGAVLFPNSRRGWIKHSRVMTEYPYRVRRRADLAFVDASDTLVALVEVKEKDQ